MNQIEPDEMRARFFIGDGIDYFRDHLVGPIRHFVSNVNRGIIRGGLTAMAFGMAWATDEYVRNYFLSDYLPIPERGFCLEEDRFREILLGTILAGMGAGGLAGIIGAEDRSLPAVFASISTALMTHAFFSSVFDQRDLNLLRFFGSLAVGYLASTVDPFQIQRMLALERLLPAMQRLADALGVAAGAQVRNAILYVEQMINHAEEAMNQEENAEAIEPDADPQIIH